MWAATNGELDDVPVEDIRRFEAEFLEHLAVTSPGVYDTIRETGDLPDDTIEALKRAIAELKRTFETTHHGLLVQEQPVEAVDEADVTQERITRVTHGHGRA
ncbi:MAG: hypothetical protein ACJ72W_27010 [Actinoallomurus sp.]